MVPVATIIITVFSMLLGATIPIASIVALKKNFDVKLKAFFIGAMIMMVASTIPSVFEATYINDSAFGILLEKYPILYGVYSGIVIALFEEFGRFLGMKFLLADIHDEDKTSLMYGLGHGGIDTLFSCVLYNIPILITSLSINKAGIDSLAQELGDEATVDRLRVLIDTPSSTYFLAAVERIEWLFIQIALSVLVWFAVTRMKKMAYLWLAILIHAFAYASPYILDSLLSNQSEVLRTVFTELYFCILIVAIVYFAIRTWKANENSERKPEKK